MIGLVDVKRKDNGFFDIRVLIVSIKSIGEIFCLKRDEA